MKRNIKLPTIIGIIVLILGVGAGVVLVQFRSIFRIKASPDMIPQDVRISNVSDNSFTASWVTEKETVGFVKWGENTPDQTTQEEGSTPAFIHSIDVRGLAPNTPYSFKINSDGEDFDNSGIAYQVQTGPAITTASSTTGVLSGTVVTATNNPVGGAVVFITATGIAPTSAVTSENGNWVVPTSQIRSVNLTSYVDVVLNNPLLEIFVQGGPNGVATAQIYASAAESIPPIILGQTNDFKSQSPPPQTDIPGAQINLPQESTPSSGFEVEETATKAADKVTLESIKPNEVITTTEPEFFGEGPVGTIVTITVESTPQTGTVTVDKNGEWDWTPPKDLEPGKHTITIKWKDAAGILQSFTRTFEVSAAAGPAFESTPSASPKASATASASPSAKPRVSLPSTESGIPDSGTLTPTLTLLIMGIGLIGTSFLIWKKI